MLVRMKQIAPGLHAILRSAIQGILNRTPVRKIRLAGWPAAEWQGDGLVTLPGDAAHAMTMYRGEAANDGFTDARNLTEQLRLWHGGLKTKAQGLGFSNLET
ncbi:hypothetical protein F4823DRAFT_631669 [Ustulina deusta]|nr:hypothetical protein F4823DRAFT_631669 [Ustulina deusta]